jgi:sensor domain CHASE-containing protein
LLVASLNNIVTSIKNIENEESVKGILAVGNELFLISIREIQTSTGPKDKQGYLALSRTLNESIITSLNENTHYQLDILSLENPEISSNMNEIIQKLKINGGYISVNGVDGEQVGQVISGYQLFNDINSTPVSVLQVTISRDEYRSGIKTINNLIIGMAGSGIVFMILGFFIANNYIYKKISECA